MGIWFFRIHYTVGDQARFCSAHYDEYEFGHVVVCVGGCVLFLGETVSEVVEEFRGASVVGRWESEEKRGKREQREQGEGEGRWMGNVSYTPHARLHWFWFYLLTSLLHDRALFFRGGFSVGGSR